MSSLLSIRPRISEKAYQQSEAMNVYVFVVPHDANKQTVAEAVATQFGVTVIAVNMTNLKGKVKRSVRRNGRSVSGTRSDTKKAYVTVKAGETIPIFGAEEQADEKADKKAKKEKK